ncbi:MAG: Gram-negative bacterial tonB protein [Syntrophorhabdus sp. PtaU1.Bin050]|nr:MAG: Gram-negative bacterial tonB protein [Syntrophorhabdus sp. PtaU1.Bin050]
MAEKMREIYFGICASVALHLCALLLFLGLCVEPHRPTETVLVDFTLINGKEGTGTMVPGPEGGGQKKKAGIEPANVHKTDRRVNDRSRAQSVSGSPVPQTADSSPAAARSLVRALSDASANTTIKGESGVTGTNAHSEAGTSAASKDGTPGAGGGSGRGGQGSGFGGTGLLQQGKDFNYIRDTIIKNVRYPEKARRIGAEGKVLLSFVVLENGSTGDVKVLKGSGFSLLDESAKEAVVRTTIQRKVPYRVVVVLPIVYELR